MSDIIEYNRPNENWECGWAKRGFKCHAGPSSNGKCPGRGECEPVKKEDGFHCTRLPQYGGKCHQGPLPDGTCSKKFPPCSPKRSLRAKRGLTTLSLVALSLGLLFFQLGRSESGAKFFSPGAVSFKHSSILNNCATCHKQTHDRPIDWLFTGGAGHQQGVKCLECHKMGKHPYQPHSLPASDLAVITASITGEASHKSVDNELECNTCHSEHKGADFDLTAMTKKQCQTCHAQEFDSLEKGHPEFGTYPFSKRVQILFDHTEHFNKHFPDKGGEKVSCNTCHTPSSSGNKMVLNGFEQSCSSCHKEQIHGDDSVNKGVVVFRVPTLDIETLRDKGIRVGSWPEDADGELTAFTKLLLAAEEEVKKSVLHVHENEVELDDLSEADKETIEHVEKIAWGIKSLLHSLKSEGASHLHDRLNTISGKEHSKDLLVQATAAMPMDVIRTATNHWFHLFDSEMEGFGSGKRKRTRAHTPKELEEEDEDQMIVGGWYKDSSSFTIRYRPTGHGDQFIRGWLELASQLIGKTPAAKQVFDSISHRKESPGACMKCHGVEKKGQKLEVKWTGMREKIGSQSFVRFSHASHLNLLQAEGCYTCHEVNKKADFSKAYKGFDATVFESNFYPLKKAACVRCHSEGKVKDNCLTCHNYHIGDFFTSEEQMKRIHTQLDKSSEEADKK